MIYSYLAVFQILCITNGSMSAISNLIKFKIFRAYPSLKPHIQFHSNGLVKWYGLEDIMHIKSIMADTNSGRCDLVFAPAHANFQTQSSYDT